MKTDKKAASTLNVDGQEMTEKQLRNLFDQRGLRQDSSYILEHLIPKYEKVVYDAVANAENTNDLLLAQGAARLLYDMKEYTTSVVKKTKKVEIT